MLSRPGKEQSKNKILFYKLLNQAGNAMGWILNFFQIRYHFIYFSISQNKIDIKDKLKVSNDFKKKQQKCMKQCLSIYKSKYILKVYSIHYILR